MGRGLHKLIAAALRHVDQRWLADDKCVAIADDDEKDLARAILGELDHLGLVRSETDSRGEPTWIATDELIRLARREPE